MHLVCFYDSSKVYGVPLGFLGVAQVCWEVLRDPLGFLGVDWESLGVLGGLLGVAWGVPGGPWEVLGRS